MQLHLDELYSVLTDEGLMATDRICELLSQDRDSDWYAQNFQKTMDALKPIVMCDHEIGIESRQKLIRGVVERSGLDEDIFQHVGREFAQFIQPKASTEFLKVFNTIGVDELWQHINNVNSNTKRSFYYGQWSEEFTYQKALQALILTEHELTLHSIRHQEQEKTWPQFKPNASKDDMMAKIVERITSANIPSLQQAQKALAALQNHPNFSLFVNHLLTTQYHNYADHTNRGLVLFDFDNQLTLHVKETIARVHKETLVLLEEFQPTQLSLMAQMWADKVQQRCTTLLSHMHQASNELYPTVVVGKDSIEERRAKEPNDGLHVAVAKP